MFFYLIAVAYDGSGFAGWAKQPNQFTVQGWIESVLSKVFDQKISILSASRTDKGVHALNQKFTLRLSCFLSINRLKLILTKSLKKHIVIKGVKVVSVNFHPIKDVVNKEYCYFMNLGEHNLFAKKYRWEYNLPLKTRKFNSILKIFQGEHDFFNFAFCRWKDKEKISTIRTIDLFKAQNLGENLLMIKIKARGFLRYQIRAMIGEAIKCYEGKQTIQQLRNKLENPNNLHCKYKHLAPASGLYLWKVNYSKLALF